MWGTIHIHGLPKLKSAATPELQLCKKEAKAVLAAFGGPSIAGHT